MMQAITLYAFSVWSPERDSLKKSKQHSSGRLSQVAASSAFDSFSSKSASQLRSVCKFEKASRLKLLSACTLTWAPSIQESV